MGMTVTAAVFEGTGRPLSVQTLDLAGPREGEVLVRLAASGVCHSDFHVVRGDWTVQTPLVLGHEGAGTVEEVGPGVSHVRPGDHVVLSWVPYCGHCRYCVAGRPALCPLVQRTAFAGVMHDGTSRLSRGGETVYSYCATGSFADRVVVPATGAVPIRRDAPLDLAALIGCAVTTGVGAVLNTAGVRAGDSVLVIGCGGVGLSAVMGAVIAGATTIVAVDVNAEALTLATELGATDVLNSREQDVEAALTDLVGDGVDWAFEAIGLKPTVELAYRAIRPGGTAVVVGQAAEGVTVEIDPFVMSDREKRLVGSSYGSSHPAREFPRMADLLMAGRLDLERLVTRRIGPADLDDAFAGMAEGRPGRALITY